MIEHVWPGIGDAYELTIDEFAARAELAGEIQAGVSAKDQMKRELSRMLKG